MRFSDIFAASLVAPLVAAHGGIPGAPKLFGFGEPRQKRAADSRASRRAAQPRLNARQGGNADNRCGAAFGGAVCAPGFCCSVAGYCGQGPDYCQAPDCQFQYGPGCDANQLPSGGSTRPIPRPQLGNVPYGGEGIYSCTVPGTVAITYDDGPYIYTNSVLDQFAAYGFKATFFITGNNNGKGAIDDESKPWPAVIRRMIAEGHQVASHTWSHQDLGAITKEQRIDQMVKNEMALSNILGKFPTYMRPPYSSCAAGTGCPEDLADLGYVVSYFDLDTDDYNNVVPEKIQNAKNNFANAVNPSNPANSDFLAIAHDIHQQTAQNLTGFMLDTLVAKGYRGVTMGECMGEPQANWYRAANGRVPTSSAALPTPSNTGVSATVTSSAPTATATGVTVDGTCGAANGLSCTGFPQGTCCSQYGWCGSSVDHCGTGCQSGFGTCGSSGGSSSAASSAASSAVSSATSTAPTSVPTGPTSTDGSCGGTKGFSCIGFAQGECCSQYGWCGSTTDYCGTGCNPLFGNCGSSSGTKASQTSTASPTSSPVAQQSSITPPTSSRSTQVSSSTPAPSSKPTTTTTVAAPSSKPTTTTTTTAAPSSKPTTTTTTRASTTTTSTAAPKPTGQKTRDGTCGGRNGFQCIGFFLGECCNARGTRMGFCSNTKDACVTNCNPLYGNCGSQYTRTTFFGRGW